MLDADDDRLYVLTWFHNAISIVDMRLAALRDPSSRAGCMTKGACPVRKGPPIPVSWQTLCSRAADTVWRATSSWADATRTPGVASSKGPSSSRSPNRLADAGATSKTEQQDVGTAPRTGTALLFFFREGTRVYAQHIDIDLSSAGAPPQVARHHPGLYRRQSGERRHRELPGQLVDPR